MHDQNRVICDQIPSNNQFSKHQLSPEKQINHQFQLYQATNKKSN